MNWYHLLGMASVSKWIVLSIFHPGWDPTWFVVCSSFTFYSFVQQKFIKNILCASILHSGNDEKKEKKKKRKRKKKRKKIPSAPWNLHSLQSKSHSLLSFSLLFALSPTSVSKLFGTILLLPHPQCVKPPCLAPTRFTPYRICSWVHVQYRQTLQCLLMA